MHTKGDTKGQSLSLITQASVELVQTVFTQNTAVSTGCTETLPD